MPTPSVFAGDKSISRSFLMKKILVLVVVGVVALSACSKSGGGGGKSLNSAAELKEYLDKQPANSPDKPIKVAMKVNDMMIKDIVKVLNDAGKYVSLNLSGSPLTEISGFGGCKTLAGITIPSSVTSLGQYAFQRCTGLTSVTISKGVTNIGYMVFAYCTNLTSITIPNSVTEIGGSAFEDCAGLTSITIPNSVTEIGGFAFDGCESLKSITIPNSVTFVGEQAFNRWTSSQTINIQGKANREATIAAGWDERWDINHYDYSRQPFEAQINYGK